MAHISANDELLGLGLKSLRDALKRDGKAMSRRLARALANLPEATRGAIVDTALSEIDGLLVHIDTELHATKLVGEILERPTYF